MACSGVVQSLVQPAGHHLPHVEGAVPVVVPQEHQLRRKDAQRTTRHGEHPARQHELVREDLAPVHHAVPVVVAEDRDDPDGIQLAGPVGIPHVPAHLHDPHATELVEGDLDRVHDEGLRRGEADLEALGELERRELLLRRQGWSRRDLEGVGQVRLGVVLAVAGLGNAGTQRARNSAAVGWGMTRS